MEKFLRGVNVMDEHGPLLVFAAVLIVAGVQLIALGTAGRVAGAALPRAHQARALYRRPRAALFAQPGRAGGLKKVVSG